MAILQCGASHYFQVRPGELAWGKIGPVGLSTLDVVLFCPWLWSSFDQPLRNVVSQMSITSIRALRILMPLSAFISLFAQLISIFTNQWLYTVELMPNDQYEKFRMPPEMEFNQKHTTSGLWLLCYNDRKWILPKVSVFMICVWLCLFNRVETNYFLFPAPDMLMKCMDIDYFTEEEYVPDQNDSTMAIPCKYSLVSVPKFKLTFTVFRYCQDCGHLLPDQHHNSCHRTFVLLPEQMLRISTYHNVHLGNSLHTVR